MGQVLGHDRSIIPYDVNGWRRLSFTYLNAITENGEILLDENGVPIDPKTLTGGPGTPGSLRKGAGGGGSRPPSRQSSFSSSKHGYDTSEQGGGISSSSARASFRTGFPSERPVLQEYQPKGKTSSDWNKEGGQSQRSSTRTTSSNHQHQHQQNESTNNRGGGRRYHSGDDNSAGDTTRYADLAFPEKNGVGFGAEKGPPGGPGLHSGPSGGGIHPPRVVIGGKERWDAVEGGGDHRRVRIEEDGRHQSRGEGGGEVFDSSDGRHKQQHLYSNTGGYSNDLNNHRAQSPKSSATWNSSSDEYGNSFYSDQHQNRQLKQIDPLRYDQAHQNGGKSSHLLPPPLQNGFSSRQSSGRTANSSSEKSTTYLPFNDYYLDRRLRGQHHLYNSSPGGPPTYSDFSGYSSPHYRNFRRRRTGVEHRPTGVAKWLFVLAALANVAATIWGSGVYLHLASKKLEIGETIQDKNVHMSETARHAWEGVILGAQVLNSLITLAAIYAAFAERYWILWCYTLLMAAYSLLGAVSELARGSYTAWILPLICVQLAIVLCHHVAVNRANRGK